ncbi:MAG TPA: hypothetical protein QGH10_10005, partial [Armatimonadota bacterium]|nr:hypothetical protein [Armatimonadota bacterium]
PYSGGDQAVAFSSDGRRYAYPCYHHGAAHVVVDGVEGPPYEEVCVPAFSPDGQRVTYGARRNGRWHVVVDGIEGPACDGISAPKFTGNGSRVAYSGRRGSRWYVMAGDREFASGNDPIYPTVSSAGDHVAWREQRDARWIVFLDGVGGLASDAKECQLSFSPDGSRLAYTIERDGRWHVVVDGDVVPGAGHTGIGYWGRRGPFSPDGKRWAYKAKHVGAWSGARWSVVTDRIEGPIYKTADSPAFSPDSQHVVYRATRRVRADEAQQHDDGRHPSDSALVNVIVVDHEEGPGFRMAHLYRPPFENDGSAGYFAATQKGLFRVTHVPPMPAEE